MTKALSKKAIRSSVAAVTDPIADELGELALQCGVSRVASGELSALMRDIANAEQLLVSLLFRGSEFIRVFNLGSPDGGSDG
jgi:hypothetical protein